MAALHAHHFLRRRRGKVGCSFLTLLLVVPSAAALSAFLLAGRLDEERCAFSSLSLSLPRSSKSQPALADCLHVRDVTTRRVAETVLRAARGGGGSGARPPRRKKGQQGARLKSDASRKQNTSRARPARRSGGGAAAGLKRKSALLLSLSRRFENAEELGKVDLAEELYLKMMACTKTAMLNVYAKNEMKDKMMEIFVDMKQSTIRPDEAAYGIVMKSLASSGQTEAAMKLITEMHAEGLRVNNVHYKIALKSLLINATTNVHNRQRSLEILEEMKSRGLEPDTVDYGTVMITYLAAGDTNGAIEQLEKMKDIGIAPSDIRDRCMGSVRTLADSGCVEEAEQWLQRMRALEIQPSAAPYKALISGHAKVGNAQEACRMLDMMQQDGVPPTLLNLNCVVSAHARAGNFSGALDWLDIMPSMNVTPTNITYSSITSEMAKRGDALDDSDAEVAEKLLKHMLSNHGLPPAQLTKSFFLKILGSVRYNSLTAPLGTSPPSEAK